MKSARRPRRCEPRFTRPGFVLAALAFVPFASSGCNGQDEPVATHEPVLTTGEAKAVPGARPARGAQPNIVVVMTDDQDVRSLRVMRSVRRLLASRGVTFTRFYATFPLCCPSRATFLTGQYSHNHGVVDNKLPKGGYPALRRKSDTLGVWLQEAGYRTAWIGKFVNVYGHDGDYSIPPGWTHWQVPVELTELRMYGYQLNEDGRIVQHGDTDSEYQTDVLAGKAVEFIRSSAPSDEPFFLTLSTLAPHDEYDGIDTGDRDPRPAPRHHGTFADRRLPRVPSFNERDVSDKPPQIATRPPLSPADIRKLRPLRLGRLESLLAVDEAVADLVAALRDTGELQRTVILFTSDNGLVIGEHRLTTAKAVPYEEATKVPLIMTGPGLEKGVRRSQLSGNVDLAATILDLADARPTRRPDGTSLLPAARGDEDRGRVILLEAAASWAGVRNGRWSYVEHRNGEAELYDLAADPFQLRSLAHARRYASVRRHLARTLESVRDCAGNACRVGTRPPPVP